MDASTPVRWLPWTAVDDTGMKSTCSQCSAWLSSSISSSSGVLCSQCVLMCLQPYACHFVMPYMFSLLHSIS